MLSKTTSKLLKIVVKWTSFFGGIPFEWDDRRSKVKLTVKGWTKWCTWVGYLIFNLSWSIFRVIWISHPSSKKHENTINRIFHKMKEMELMIVHVILAVIHLGIYYHHLEYVCFLNSFVRYCQHFKNSFVTRLGGRRRHWRNGCEDLLKIIISLTVIFPFLVILSFIIDPKQPGSIISLLPDSTPRPIFIVICILYGIIQFLWMISATSSVTYFIFLGILVPSLTFTLLSEATGGQCYYVTRTSLRKPTSLCRFQRSIQVLCNLVNTCFKHTFPMMKACCEGLAIIGNCSLIKFWRLETPISRLILFLIPNLYLISWLNILYINGFMWKKSACCISSWKRIKFRHHRDNVIMRKFQRSCTPIRVYVGGFYFVKPVKVIITINSLLKQTMKLLISLGKKIP